MFGFFRSRVACPVTSEARGWIEQRMAWLTEEFGCKRVQSVRVILPTPEFFPDPYNGTREDALRMLERVCGYMGIEPETVELSLYRERNPLSNGELWQGTAGLYHEEVRKYRISVEVANLGDPLALVATMAHELGHVHLLGHGRITPDVEDHEPLTDLLTVFLGMGVFTANSVIREHYQDTALSSMWSIGRRGYLTMPMYGYALALFARRRGEEKPRWARELRLDVRSSFKQAMRFLNESEASGPQVQQS